LVENPSTRGFTTLSAQLRHPRSRLEKAQWEKCEEILARASTIAVDENDFLGVTLARTSNLFWAATRKAEALAVNAAANRRVASSDGQRMLRINEGTMRTIAGEPARGLTLLEENLEENLERAPDVNVWLWGALAKTVGLALAGRTSEATAWGEYAYRTHLSVDERTLITHPTAHTTSLILAFTEAGRLDEARAKGEYVFTDAVAVRAGVARVWTACFLGRAELVAGHLTEARNWYAESVALARKYRSVIALPLALSGLAASTAMLGDQEGAEKALNQLQGVPQTGHLTGEEKLGKAWLQAVRGRLTEARFMLTEAAQSARGTGHLTSEMLLLTDIARLGGAKDVAARMAVLAKICDGAFAPARAHMVAALAADDHDQLLAASGELEAIGADLPAAEAATAAAAALRKSGQARQAAVAAQRAQACAARCQGARTPLLMTPQTTASLTAREREIALLAVQGTASKDIADFLHLSVRTVDNHLQHVYAKLGVTTRRQLADSIGSTPTRS
ncbi:response regulator transcription factor, partial [Streptomyces sp. NPDC052013]|uniref:response regulator transcription factor n=1 Tax=Streptomyces sp. NPDC052013 TaxID=3365679 RepID=UPI0037D37640